MTNLCRLTRPDGIAIVSVPALPELFTEFDRVQGHRRRYLPETLKRAFKGSDFKIEQLLWWWGWLVPLLRVQRLRRTALQGMTPMQTYAEYLKLPRWPLSSALRVGFFLDQHLALRGMIRRGTSLIAVARRTR